ncbi:hypothetical protein [Nocardia jejuensis]|uniref:hypothetical protein n=1 Tax=Nocardia jejuensis TaxID=328049 RepID=UPI0008311624|nr:hypothetical protein [Nocardia jejuensis]
MAEETARLDGNALVLAGGVRVRFIRTLRLPEEGTHALPPGLGEFPIRRVADYADSVPEEWRRRGGVMLPMYVREAMWLSFSAEEPAALQVGVGKVCAVSGRPWSAELGRDPQNYVVLPRQPWLDGINSGQGTIRQFVSVPLGLGATVEGQVTGEEVWGGVQLQSFGLEPRALELWREQQAMEQLRTQHYGGYGIQSELAGGPGSSGFGSPADLPTQVGAVPPPAPPAYGAPLPPSGPAYESTAMSAVERTGSHPIPGSAPGAAPTGSSRGRKAKAMGLGVGGTMRQEIFEDDRPMRDWAGTPSGRVFVHLVTPPDWRHITGEEPPASPVNRRAYTAAGLPWFEYFDADALDLDPVEVLTGVSPVGEWLGDDHDPWHEPTPGQVIPLGEKGKPVEDGDW